MKYDLKGPGPLGEALARLLGELVLPPHVLGAIRILGDDPQFESPVRIGGAMAVAMLAAAAAAAALGNARELPAQDLTLDVADAARHIFSEENHAPRLCNRPFGAVGRADPTFLRGIYRTRDGAYFVPTALSARERAAWAQALGVKDVAAPAPGGKALDASGYAADFAAAVAAAVAKRDGHALEGQAAALGLAGVMCRTAAAWAQHPHGVRQLRRPLIEQWPSQIDGAPPLVGGPTRPLAGVRVLVLGRVFAAPLVGRTLSEQGAQVLHVGNARGGEHLGVYLESFVGGRSARANLRLGHDAARVRLLAAQADVVVDNVRSGTLAPFGLDGATLRRRHPWAVHLHIDAYGSCGPFAGRAGYDMNAAATTGLLWPMATGLDAGKDVPKWLPSMLLVDFVAGYLGAAAVAAALRRRHLCGHGTGLGLSLSRVASWCLALPKLDATALCKGHQCCTLPRQRTYMTAIGPLRRLVPPVTFSHTPPSWTEPVLYAQGSCSLRWI